MPNKFDSNGMIHQWIYVIIPVQERYRSDNQSANNYIPATFPLFCAFCKVCRNYFTERMTFKPNFGAEMELSSLPRYGCEPPDDVPVLTPEMGLVV